MNPLAALHARVDTWAPWLKLAYYAAESTVIAALVLVGGQLLALLEAGKPIDVADLSHTFLLTVEIGIVKALIDALKSWGPPKE